MQPSIFAQPAGGVTLAHFDELDSLVLQAAGTRIASLWGPATALNPIGPLDVVHLHAHHGNTLRIVPPHDDPDRLAFPLSYTAIPCRGSRGHNCRQTREHVISSVPTASGSNWATKTALIRSTTSRRST